MITLLLLIHLFKKLCNPTYPFKKIKKDETDKYYSMKNISDYQDKQWRRRR